MWGGEGKDGVRSGGVKADWQVGVRLVLLGLRAQMLAWMVSASYLCGTEVLAVRSITTALPAHLRSYLSVCLYRSWVVPMGVRVWSFHCLHFRIGRCPAD